MPQPDEWVDFWQSDRWYHYRLRRNFWRIPLSCDYVREHSADVHIVPANSTRPIGLQDVGIDDLAFMEGKLVDIEVEKDQVLQQYFTSLTRSDEGDASCKIMCVERLVRNGIEYR